MNNPSYTEMVQELLSLVYTNNSLSFSSLLQSGMVVLNSLLRGFSHLVFSPFAFRAILAVFLGKENILPPTDSNPCL